MNLNETLLDYEAKGLLYKQVHPTLPLTIWNYTDKCQYDGAWDDITLMCRGLVTDDLGNIVARPLRKFFNLEEGRHEPTKDFDVYEKEDGSLIILFFYDGQWIVASRGSFTSDQAVWARELIYNKDLRRLQEPLTYVFELIHPENRICVDYGGRKELIFLTSFHTEYGNEFITMPPLGTTCVKQYDGLKDISALKSLIENNREGFVVKFSNGHRVKIKGEEYLRLHRLMTCLSTTSVWEVLSGGGTIADVLVNVPDEFYELIHSYEKSLIEEYDRVLSNALVDFVEAVSNTTSRKEFADFVKDKQHKRLLFNLYDKKSVKKEIWDIIKPKYKKL